MNLFEFQKAIITSKSPFEGKDSQLEELYYSANDEERKLLVLLFNRFYSITFDQKRVFRKSFIESLLNNKELLSTSLLFGTLVTNEKPDSGQSIIYEIEIEFKKQLRELKRNQPDIIVNSSFKNHFGKVESTLDTNPQKNYSVILTDEFIGSGATLTNRLNILNRFKNISNIHTFFFAGMEFALNEILSAFPDLKSHTYRVLKKGISESYSSSVEINNNLKTMSNIESRLKQKVNGISINKYNFGYNQAESLYNNELIDGNIPNNVFPVFWWPRNENNETRNCVFIRVDDNIIW